MITFPFAEALRSGLAGRAGRPGANPGFASWVRWLRNLALAWLGAGVLGGCASGPEPEIDDDLVAFTQGIDGILKTGMTYKEARKALLAQMPEPSIQTEGPVPGVSRATRMRRFMIGWPTLNPGTTLIVTIFVDAEGRIVRWTTGPLTENR